MKFFKKYKKLFSILLIIGMFTQIVAPAGGLYASADDTLNTNEIEENLLTEFSMTFTDDDGNSTVIEDNSEHEVDLEKVNSVLINYKLVRPNDLTVSDGDTYTIDLPDFFSGSITNQPITVGEGIEIATYSIVDGQVVITFNENANNYDDAKLDVKLSGNFETEVFETVDEVVVDVPFKNGDSFTTTIKAKENPYEAEDKKTAGFQYVLDGDEKNEVNRNPEYIDWTVLANDSMESFSNAKIIDDLGDNLEIVEGSIKAFRITRNYKNEEISRDEITITADMIEYNSSGFKLELGDIEDAYEVTYTTKITRPDGGGTHTINNNARIVLDNEEKEVNDSFEGTWSGDIPTILKTGHKTDDPHTLDWEIEYNFGKEELGIINLTDNLTHGEIDLNSIEIYEVDVDIDGNIISGSKQSVDITTELSEGKLTIPSLDANGKAYYITYSSKVPVGLNDTVTNTISDDLTPPNTDSDSVDVNTVPTGGKVGEQHVDENGKPYIEWTITLNSNMVDVGSITVRDVFNQDYLDFDVDNTSLYKLLKNGEEVDNFEIKNFPHNDDREGFELTVKEAGAHTYEFVYKTYYTVAGMNQSELANSAELVFLDGNGDGIGDPVEVPEVTLKGPKAGIDKSGNYVLNNDGDQEIKWSVNFNKSKILLKEESKIEENFVSDNFSYIDNSLKLTDSEGGNLEEGTDYSLTINADNSGFVLKLLKATKKELKLTFRTTVDDTNNLDHKNKVDLVWEGGTESAESTVTKRDAGINKSGEVVINADGSKTVNWTVKFNTNKNVIHDFELTDSYTPTTVTVSDIKIKTNNADVTSDFTISDERTGGSFTASKDRLEAEEYKLTYSTTLSPTEEQSNITNQVNIEYRGGSGKADASIIKPTLGVEKEANSIDKTGDKPVISWTIYANTDNKNKYVNLVDAVLEDIIPTDQRLVSGSVKAVRFDDNNIEVSRDSINEQENSFTIELPDGPYKYKITLKTEILEIPSSDDNIFDKYNNSIKLENQTKDEDLYQFDNADASIRYYEGVTNDLTAKTGKQNDDTENIDYEVTINPEGLTINNAKIKDSLSNHHEYVESSIKLFDADGNEVATGFNLDVSADSSSFEIDFKTQSNDKGTIDSKYSINYSTRLKANLVGTYKVENNILLTGGTEETVLDSTSTTTTAQQWFYGGGGSGRTIQFDINKKSPEGSLLKGVGFELERLTFSGDKVSVDTNAVTDENGVYNSGELRAGRFILTETSAHEGYKKLNNPIYFSVGYTEVEGEYKITLMDSEWNEAENSNATAEENVLTVVNDYEPVTEEFEANKVLKGQKLQTDHFSFELLNEDKVVIAEAKNDTNGNVKFEKQSFYSPGTYNFKIREVDSKLGGIAYDSSIYNVQVIVSEGSTGLKVDPVKYLDGEANFRNSYSANSTQATIQAKKELNGQDLSESQFKFELVDNEDTVIQTKENNAKGQVIFDEIIYDKAGNYNYKIREVKGSQGGMTYDDSTFDVIIEVTDDGKGQLHSKVINPNNKIPIFTNVYAANSVSFNLEAEKVLEGRILLANEFKFKLVGEDDLINETVFNNESGKIAFSDITYTTPGEYSYTIQEIEGKLGGVEYDKTIQNVTVIVTDDGQGQLLAEANYENEAAVFTNVYTTTPVEATINGEKILEGQSLTNGQFSFELLNNQGHIIETVVNDEEGNIAFSPITYETTGDYIYSVREKRGTQGGITYSDAVFEVIVSVTDNGEGELESEVIYTEGPISFLNKYEASPDSIVFEAEKILEGQALRNEHFEFELINESNEVIQRVSNNRNGQVVFNEISFKETGTYDYIIKEVEGTQGGITYDDTIFNVTVTVTDDGEGQLIAEETYSDGPAVFTNIYTTEPDSIVIEATKYLEGQELVNDQFEFELIDESGQTIQKTRNNADGQIIFDEITYSETGSHTYIIREVEGVQGGVTYDKRQFVLVISVNDDGQGNLVAKANYISGTPVFKNTYEANVDSVVIEASKTLEGQELKKGQFKFELIDQDNTVIQTKENNAEGQVIFDEITYKKAGNYNYTIREVEGKQVGVTYDDTVHKVNVSVTDDREGTLTAKIQYADKLLEFNNIYITPKTDITIEKVWIGGPEEKPAIQIELYRNDEVIDKVTLENGEEEYTFKDLDVTDKEGVEYKYTVDEVEVPEDYDKTISEDGLTITNTHEDVGAADRPETPGTGIENNQMYFVAIMTVSTLLLLSLGIKRKRRQQ